MAEIANKRSMVGEALDNLSTSLGSLTDLTQKLEDRLSFSMGPGGPSVKGDEIGQDGSSCSSLRMTVLEYVSIVDRARSRITEILDRLEV